MNKIKKNLNFKIKIPSKTEIKEGPLFSDNKSTITEINPNIYISGYIIANDIDYLLKNNFTHVLNCCSGSSLINNSPSVNYMNIKYLKINLRDDPNADIINALFLTINFIEDGQENNKILFHCVEGVSRGPALLIGYLMWKNNISRDDGISLVKKKRNCVDINFGFMVQLSKWEKFLNDKYDEKVIFKLNKEISLVEEKNIEKLNNDINLGEKFLIRWKGKLFLIEGNYSKQLGKKEEIIIKNFIDNVLKFDNNIIDKKNLINIQLTNDKINEGIFFNEICKVYDNFRNELFSKNI